VPPLPGLTLLTLFILRYHTLRWRAGLHLLPRYPFTPRVLAFVDDFLLFTGYPITRYVGLHLLLITVVFGYYVTTGVCRPFVTITLPCLNPRRAMPILPVAVTYNPAVLAILLRSACLALIPGLPF